MQNSKEMELVLINRTYKCEKAVLKNNVEVSADLVTVKDGKVVFVENAFVAIKNGNENDDRYFNFSVYSDGTAYNLNNAPAEIDGRAIIMEFIALVESEIV